MPDAAPVPVAGAIPAAVIKRSGQKALFELAKIAWAIARAVL